MTTQQLRETAEAVIEAWKKWVTTHGRRNYSELTAAVHSFGTVDSAHAVVALLADLEAAKKDAEAAWASLPGVTYMDPPDGGSPTLAEQMGRMAKDAERYRWIKNDLTGKADEAVIVWEDSESDGPYLRIGEDLDAAIDAALNPAREDV